MKTLCALTALIFVLLTACGSDDFSESAGTTETPTETTSPAGELLARAVVAHGGKRYDKAAYGFTFRDKAYTFRNNGLAYRYTRIIETEGSTTLDVLIDGQITRTVDGKIVELSEKDQARHRESINSVIYFATLPHKLQDPAVNLTPAGEEMIDGIPYDRLRVHFNEEGGGTDHDDNFVYWVNRETDRIDFLAYDYRTNGGGVRFRSAYNPRIVNGILFQDYVNYKAPIGTKLEDLSAMHFRKELEELSRIETENVKAL